MPPASPLPTPADRRALDEVMERASLALASMAYARCEALCMEALAGAREAGDWGYYARVLLPLQESRRQRRMAAAEGEIRLGPSPLEGGADGWLGRLEAGCVALARPHTAEDARALDEAARAKGRAVEVLFIDSQARQPRWRVRAFAGPDASRDVPAPPPGWIGSRDRPGEGDGSASGPSPADWFIDAAEALGDASLAQVHAPLGTGQRVAQLERRLAVVRDHELLHQALGEAARARAAGAGHP